MKTPLALSPYKLMQEEFRDQPWKLLVGCILLNQVSAKVARPIWEKFFEMYPTPEKLHDAPTSSALADMTVLFRPLGFQNRRSTRVLCMTEGYLEELWRVNQDVRQVRVEQLYGVGKYAADSFNMFVKSILPESENEIKDKELKNYVRWARALST